MLNPLYKKGSRWNHYVVVVSTMRDPCPAILVVDLYLIVES